MSPGNSLTGQRPYEFGSFRLNPVERVLESHGRPLSIAPKTLEVLIVLVENRGHISHGTTRWPRVPVWVEGVPRTAMRGDLAGAGLRQARERTPRRLQVYGTVRKTAGAGLENMHYAV